jgi:hypothetical protein
MRYIRMYKGTEAGAPGVTLYEIDRGGWVHRQLQIHADTVRFSPEDILLRRPVSLAYMAGHPDTEEITAEEFELHWAEFDHRRRFREHVPNPWLAWQGQLSGGARPRRLAWVPSGSHPGSGWVRVPGFVRLFVCGDVDDAWTVQNDLFLESPIEWTAVLADGLQQPVRARQIVDGPGLAAALRQGRAAASLGLT